MKNLLLVLAALLVVAGCGDSDRGELPPPAKEMTQEEINAMPPQARAAMESAQKAGQESKARAEANAAAQQGGR